MDQGTNASLFFLLPDDKRIWTYITGLSPTSFREMEKEAKGVYELYNKHWAEWVRSPICFLDEIDIRLVQMWYEKPNVNLIAAQTNYSKNNVYSRLKRAFRRMLRLGKFVKQWFALANNTERVEFLRHAPISMLGFIPLHTRNVLTQGAESLHDVAFNIGPDIYLQRGAGLKTNQQIHIALEYVGLLNEFLKFKPKPKDLPL
jgi:hypothetical protein